MNATGPKSSLRFSLSLLPALLGLVASLALPLPAGAAEAIRIGEINSQGRQSTSGQAYRNGLALALEQINEAGGINGRPLQLVVREDDGDADQAARNAKELVSNEHVEVLTGTMLSDVALAVARQAARSKTVLVVGDALSDAITLDKGNRYTFRVRPSTYMQAAMLAEQAARMPGRRWAVVAPNYEYGQSAVASFKMLLKQARPDVEFVSDQWPALGKIKADDVVRAIRQSRPDGIFNATFGEDLQKLVQAGHRQQLFNGVRVVSMGAVGTQALDPSQSEAIRDWVSIGYPGEQINTPEHQRFLDAYMKKFSEPPQLPVVVGYSTMLAIAGGLRKSEGGDGEALVEALRGLHWSSPLGELSFRALDQQSTMGAFIGLVSQKDGRSSLREWHYLDGTAYLPPPTYVRSRRPASAIR
ncbi:ABC-type branched-chain amino acid transport systems periplasmic component, protein [Herbaspirillum rubrisubalbicans M1]|uniref:ABC transporter substrate-binding protein n=1 Tax=Herbaspirillum rubrisubalbicans TaxID=80842 RepID=UPI00073ADB77|nr:ABC transporter substrate-binding protein [Herbaspirillum rubrisubalbicans]ALU88723.1 ABC-type branched-chain amino acid transport systems periplasmic component, protein [Herbaspirillum rubrisubalbicans M1]